MVSAVSRRVEIGTLSARTPRVKTAQQSTAPNTAASPTSRSNPRAAPFPARISVTPENPSSPPVTTGRRSASMPVAAPRNATMSGVVATMSEALATEVCSSPYMKNAWYRVLLSTPIQTSGHQAARGAPMDPSRHCNTASRMTVAIANRSPANASPGISPSAIFMKLKLAPQINTTASIATSARATRRASVTPGSRREHSGTRSCEGASGASWH